MEKKMNGQLIQSSVFHRLALALIVVLTALMASCNLLAEKPSNFIQSRELLFPNVNTYYALILKDEKLVALINGGSQSDLLSYAMENDSSPTLFSLPSDPDCFLTNYYGDESLPDGKLQILKLCGSGGNGTDTYLMAYDWETQRLEKLVGPLPLGTSGASWNPQGTKAIGYLDSGFASKTLFWVYPDGFEPLDLVIQDDGRSWNLQDDFPKFTADDTGKSGTTGRASWSPDEVAIAFFASPDAIGKTSFERFGVEHYLYLMNPETLQYEVVADKIFSPFLLSWSPDSNYIAFIGHYGFRKENGIWLYSIKTNSITEVSKGIFQDIVWRPDGNRLVAIGCEDLGVCNKILEYDLTTILE